MRNASDVRFVLYHSNDIHSRLENAAKIATAIAEERRVLGQERVLAVDCGDHMDRMRQETEGTDGEVNVALLNDAGYEVATIGNNEGLTFSQEQLAGLYGDAKFSVVCANAMNLLTDELPDWLQSRTVIEKNGLKIGFTAATANFHNVYKLLGWKTIEPLAAIQRQVDKLRMESDIVVVISHLGLPLDRQMAEELSGIDLILGAHTHHLLEEPLYINNTVVCAAGKFGEYAGRVEVYWDQATGKPSFRAQCMPTAALTEQEGAAAIIAAYKQRATQNLSRVIAHLPAAIPTRLDAESDFGNLLAEGLRRWTSADIGVVNAGQLLGGLAQGDVTFGELHSLCPSPINPSLALLKGNDLRLAFEQSLQEEYIYKPIKGFGFRGEKLGVLALAGVQIEFDSALPSGRQITSIYINGEQLDDDKLYKTGTIDMFSFRVGYESLANASEIQFFMPQFIRHVIEEELKHKDSLMKCKQKRWFLTKR